MSVAIGLGCADFPFSGAAAYWRWIDMCEAGGVDSIWQTDRIVSRQPFLESMTTMAALAGRTRRMRFGMNVVSLAFRDPVLLAKQCATIDVLSEGRLLPAFGIGSIRNLQRVRFGGVEYVIREFCRQLRQFLLDCIEPFTFGANECDA